MNLAITLQNKTTARDLPSEANMRKYIAAAVIKSNLNSQMTVRIVNEAESQQLNSSYRDKDKPTNVLAFPYDEVNYLGDLVVCAPVVAREAAEQQKSLEAHWAHLLIHGTLHLQGYDHIKEADRIEMEALEIQILKSLHFSNPYEEEIL